MFDTINHVINAGKYLTPSNQKKWPYTNNYIRMQFINVVYFELISITTGILSAQLGVFWAHKYLTNKSFEIPIINQLFMAYASIVYSDVRY